MYYNRIVLIFTLLLLVQILCSFIHDIYEIYSTRKKSNESGIIFIIIKNLQFLDIIKSMLKGEIVEESEYIETEDDSNSSSR